MKNDFVFIELMEVQNRTSANGKDYQVGTIRVKKPDATQYDGTPILSIFGDELISRIKKLEGNELIECYINIRGVYSEKYERFFNNVCLEDFKLIEEAPNTVNKKAMETSYVKKDNSSTKDTNTEYESDDLPF